jgi:hypothetical protein
MGTKSKSIALVIVALFLASLVSFEPATVKAQPKTIVVPDDYATLDAAIGNATNSDTILVKSGTYIQQTLEINKSLTIVSEYTGNAKIILHPPKIPENLFGTIIMTYANPINIQANKVRLSGFVINSDGGTVFADGDQIQLTNNRVETWGVVVAGNGNRITDNKMATVTLTGSNQTIVNNDLSDLSVTGSFNLIAQNRGRCITLNGSYNTINQNYFSIISGTEGGSVSGIHLLTGDHNIITSNTAMGMGTGIAVGLLGRGGSYNIFAGNTVEQAGLWGILMGNGSYNVFCGNLIANNRRLDHDGYGLALGGNHQIVESNLFFHNAFVNNSKNFAVNWGITGINFFDNGVEGNYWDDYITKYPNATEIDNSGIGNIPYCVWIHDNFYDNYPLIMQPDTAGLIPVLLEPWQTFLTITTLTDPSLSFVPSSTPEPTLTPTSSPIETPSPNTSPTLNPTPSPTTSSNQEPSPLTQLLLPLLRSH